jgi:uncharacterized protein YvpB
MGKVYLTYSKTDNSGGANGAVYNSELTQEQMDAINAATVEADDLNGKSLGSVIGVLLRATPVSAKVTIDQYTSEITLQTATNSWDILTLAASESVVGDFGE